MNFDDRLKLDNFQEPTTYANDYRPYSPRDKRKYKWPKDKIEKPQKTPPEYFQLDIETFYPFKKEFPVPFNRLWRPRPILETDPTRPYPKHLQDEDDVGKEEAIKTRPRLYMSPAISIDDVPEKEMREMICKNVYQTEWSRAAEEVWKYLKKTKRDVFDSVRDADHGVDFTFDLYPPVPEKWRNYDMRWDERQPRALVEPTKEFWLNYKQKSEANALQKIIPPEVKTEIADLIEDDRLRLAHDKTKPGYTGYKPKLSMGVALAKEDFPITHPSLTVAQTIAQRWRDAY
ncbi:hypothetical protein Trydic_g20166 [Trypoxylus dichotomus]